MDDRQLGLTVRLLRHRRGWRQIDLAVRAGVSASLVSLLEGGRADRLSVLAIRAITRALGITLRWDVGYRRAELDLLRDRHHAAIAEWLAGFLTRLGWQVAAEVSFNQYGDRGRIDLLAYEPVSRTLLVIEIKTAIADIQELLGGINVKVRVAGVPANRLGWRPARVIPMLVVAETTTNRRRLVAHARLFAHFSLRGRAIRPWLRQPHAAPDGILLVTKQPNANHVGVRRAGRQRVRVPIARTSVDEAARATQTRAGRG
jgi:transcriptional regulator with XRE-family HTH domain